MSKLITLLSTALLMSACASEAEKEERRQNAFDLSGVYKVSKTSGSSLDMNFEVRNETGRHDIVVYLEKPEELTEKNRQFLAKEGLDVEKVKRHFGRNITLGAGYNKNHSNGGENISDDFGESSRFSVCSDEMRYDQIYKISYCLSGTAKKKGRELNGNLSMFMHKTETLVDENGEKKTIHTLSMVDNPFRSDISLIFYKQYLGNWSGDVYSLVGNFDADKFHRLRVREVNKQVVSDFVGLNSFEFRGDKYKYSRDYSSMPLEDLKVPDYPAIQVVYVGSNGRRIVLFGQFWSLGDFTGSISLIHKDDQSDLATFRMKKD